MTSGHVNLTWARTALDELARQGIGTVCIAPGSRSTPLVLAAAEHPRLRVVTHLDERSAAFFALGVGKATRKPAAVITTSGTAAANLFPAVVEASQSGTPLLLLTADRPHALRGADANQAIDQLKLFGPYVRRFVDVAPPSADGPALRHVRSVMARAAFDAVGIDPGPVHLNMPFAKPLHPDLRGPEAGGAGGEGGRVRGAPHTATSGGVVSPSESDITTVIELLAASRRALIVAGPTPEPWVSGPAVRSLARAAGAPVLADPLSGVRFGPFDGATVIGAYDLVLRNVEARTRLSPDLVLRVGDAPTSAACNDWLRDLDAVPQIVVAAGRRWRDHLAVASHYVHSDPTSFCTVVAERVERAERAEGVDAGWTAVWSAVGTVAAAEALESAPHTEPRAVGTLEPATLTEPRAAGTLEPASLTEPRAAATPEPASLTEPRAAERVVAATPEEGWLFVSNSMPVRDVDGFAPPSARPVRVLGNRGASGVDGIVSTALGIAWGSGQPVVALLGDIALAHDMNGLLATREAGLTVIFVVVHNDGGGIFHMLPIRAFEPEFTRYFATPHGLDFRHTAALYDLPHTLVSTVDELDAALERGLTDGGSRIVEIRTDRDESRSIRERAVDRVGAALRTVFNQEDPE